MDGLSDKIINDPRDCKFDFSKLPLCPNDKAGPDCFTTQQLSAIKSIYSPTVIDNQIVYPGFPCGLEAEVGAWNDWITGSKQMPSLHFMFGTNMFKFLVYNNPSWDYSKYDFKNFFKETAYASSYLDATQTDYGDFKKRKGKMIMYHGWNDPALSAYATIQHYDEAMNKDKDLQSYIRLFLLPGVLHCGGGTGPDFVDWVKLIQDWTENDKAPERVVLSKMEKDKTVMTRPVYPYPKVTIYSGKGESTDEKSFKSKGN
jgi:feruloyl esterase